MATLHSFYISPEMWHEPFILQGQEAHHLIRVLRIREGQTIRIFDGKGRFGYFIVEKIKKNTVDLVLTQEELSPIPEKRITLATGFSKALRRGWFFEKAVELEAFSLWFWQGDYSQCSVPDKEKNSWQASLISGAKQCENPWVPSLRMMGKGVQEIVAARKNFEHAFMLYERDTDGRFLQKEDLSGYGDTLLVVGPEGGFSPKEATELINAQITPVSMGNSILRWETAAILALGFAWWARQ